MLTERLRARIRRFTATLLTEQLDPGRAAAAVFLGLFIGIVPIYGFQLLAAVALALYFKLNKPLTVAATFISNPFFQPFLIIGSIKLGFFLRHGYFQPFQLSSLIGPHGISVHVKDTLISWIIGSVALGVVIGGIGAAITAVIMRLRTPANLGLRDRIRFVNQTFAQSADTDRYFVQCKLRLDRIFGMLSDEDLGSGTVIDLGCGYGMALCFTAFGESGRRLVGCDLNARRVEVARKAFSSFNAEVSVEDVRHFGLPPAGLILILDVLQYLPAEEQEILLKRCCSALDPEGRLIFRAHDRDRGLWSVITLGLDRFLFSWERTGTRPMTLSAPQYQRMLESAGMEVETRRFRNHLPLAHILFIAKRPFAETAS